jgi:hypothetical protein
MGEPDQLGQLVVTGQDEPLASKGAGSVGMAGRIRELMRETSRN